MPADILFFALVAAGLVFWLRGLLGTRHGDERQRPNPFTKPPASPSAGAPVTASAAAQDVADGAPTVPDESPASRIASIAANPTPMLAIASKDVEKGLLEIAEEDRYFDIDHFLGGAQEAFVMIVEAFARGDLETLETLLIADVYQAFAAEIHARQKRGETVETEIQAVRRMEIIDAAVRTGSLALITIRFTASETCVIRDTESRILSGDPDKATEMMDVWVFGRNVRSRDPVWYVFETRDDAPEPHKTPLPETARR